MQRQGFEIPLLIGGATTSRAHTAVKVDPQVRRPGGLGQGRLPLGADRGRAAPRPERPKLLADVKADYDSLRDAPRRQARPADGSRSRRPAPTARRSTGTATRRRRPCSPGVHVARGLRPRRAARVHRLAAVLQRLGDEGQVPRHPQQPGAPARPPASSTTTPRRCSTGSRRELADRQRRRRPLPGQRRRRRHRGLHRRRRAPRSARTLHQLRQQGEHRAGVPNRSLGRLRRAHGRPGWPTTSAASRSPPAMAPRRGRGVQGRARRLRRDPARVARRPARRGVRRAAPPAGPQGAVGLRRATSRSTTPS